MTTNHIKETENEIVEEQEEESDLYCGWGKCKPKCLQRLLSINYFLLILSLFSLLQGMLVNGLISASIPHLEREFGFTSAKTGFIISSNDIGGLLFVLVVSYYGGKGHKPKWLGYGAIVTGIGALLFALPKFLKGSYTAGTVPLHFKNFEFCLTNNTNGISTSTCENGSGGSSSIMYFLIFCASELIMGLGTTPLYTLGAIPAKLHPDSPLWVGRWWLPLITLSWVLMLIGLLLLMFPRAMPNSDSIRKKAIEAGEVEENTHNVADHGLKGFVKATLALLKNKTLVLACLAFVSKTLIVTGIGPFLTKLTVIKYGAAQSEASFMVGVLIVSGSSIGLTAGSILMRQIKVQGSVKVAAAICALLSLTGVATGFGYLAPGCESIQLAGVNVKHASGPSTTFNLMGECNKHCSCLKEYYYPLCSNDITYFSPCYAGCANKTSYIYTSCSCIQSEHNATQQEQHEPLVSKGKCNQNCKNLKLFLIIISLALVMGSLSGTPNNMIVLRAVPSDQQSFAMGIQSLLLRSLALLPGPILVGKMIDSTCIVWKYNECGEKSNCAEYDLEQLSLLLSCSSSAASAVALIFYTAAWKFYKPLRASKGKNNAYENKDYVNDETNF